jgi:ATP-dependent protease ClpP protease subunit
MNTARLAFANYMSRAVARLRHAWATASEGQSYGEPELTVDDEAKTAELRIYADIMPQMYCDWFGMGVSDTGFVRALDRIPKGYKATVRINSNGGDVTVGIAIASRLSEAKLPVVVDGIAASIASIIAAASPHVTMKAGATVMLHNPWSCVCGNAKALRAEAGVLDTLREAMLDIYTGKTGASFGRESWARALDGEDGADGSWWTGTEAVSYGFADTYETAAPITKAAQLALIESRKAAAQLHGVALPKNLDEGIAEVAPPTPESETPDTAAMGKPGTAKEIRPSVRVSNRPGSFRIPR